MSYISGSYASDQDGIAIATYSWLLPDDTMARGVVQIAHGLAEHAGRYDRFARALNDAGFHVVASDHRGHGQSIHTVGGDFGAPGFPGLQADMVQLGEELKSS
ncbi:alpha/beta hydrolase, partial [Aeromicrobium phragmitis]